MFNFLNVLGVLVSFVSILILIILNVKAYRRLSQKPRELSRYVAVYDLFWTLIAASLMYLAVGLLL